MKIGDVFQLSNEKDKYVVLAVKELKDKHYALIVPFSAKINLKEKRIKDANVDLTKAVLVSMDIFTNEIKIETNRDITAELLGKIYNR